VGEARHQPAQGGRDQDVEVAGQAGLSAALRRDHQLEWGQHLSQSDRTRNTPKRAVEAELADERQSFDQPLIHRPRRHQYPDGNR
jgi:hypothetical protein